MGTKRELIIDKSIQLFAKYGYDQIGMDFIALEANVSKITIYNHFSSKEELFKAVLIERENRFISEINSYIKKEDNPFEKIKSIFMFYHNWFNQEDFNGCLFINSTYIFANKNESFRKIIRNKKSVTKELIKTILVSVTDLQTAKKLSADIVRLLDGTIVSAQVKEENENPAIDAWEAVLMLFKGNEIEVSEVANT